MTQIPIPAPTFDPQQVGSAILAWYDRHARSLPWRAKPGEASDPYRVWLSEIMLQQTTVAAVKPFYGRFLALWPTLAALAAAPLDDVLKAWAGLGYYSRARNLHACARAVADQHGGIFPASEQALRQLPGIGDYTAAAVASIAFGQRAVVVDGNVERVMARLHAVETPLPSARPILRAAMDAVTPAMRAGDFAQAVMDLGATVCTPRSPACVICPVSEACTGRRGGEPAVYPRKAPRKTTPQRSGAVFFIEQNGKILVRTRPPEGLFGGMTEFPGTAWLDTPAPDLLLPVGITAAGTAIGTVQHGLTHFSLVLDVHLAELGGELPLACRWVPRNELDREALPTLMRKVLAVADRYRAVSRGKDAEIDADLVSPLRDAQKRNQPG